jgi:hypothetical protein
MMTSGEPVPVRAMRVRLLPVAPFRYYWTLLAWLVVALTSLLAMPSAVFVLAVNPRPQTLDLPPGLMNAPGLVLFVSLMLLLYANLSAQRLPVAGIARWVRRARTARAALWQLREDVLAFGALALLWGVFRRFGVPAWSSTRLPNAIGESLEYLLVMGLVVAWLYLLTRTARGFARWFVTQ